MATTHSGPAAPFTQEEIDKALTALVAHAGNAAAAIRYLQSEHPDQRWPTCSTLHSWVRTLHWERYEQIREQYAQKVEATVTNDLRDAAREALETQRIAVQKARERLEADKDDDPARSAANLARVTQSNADKLLSLTGRPTQITESRNVNEMLRGLIAAFPQVFSLEGQEPEQIEGSEEVSP